MLGPCTAAKPPKLSERHTPVGIDQNTPLATLAAFAAFMLASSDCLDCTKLFMSYASDCTGVLALPSIASDFPLGRSLSFFWECVLLSAVQLYRTHTHKACVAQLKMKGSFMLYKQRSCSMKFSSSLGCVLLFSRNDEELMQNCSEIFRITLQQQSWQLCTLERSLHSR
jgi:hypothetical protein